MRKLAKKKSAFENTDFKEEMEELKNFNIESLSKSILDGTLRKSLRSYNKTNKITKEEKIKISNKDDMHPQN